MRIFCIIHKPTGQVCEVSNGICYDLYRTSQQAEQSILEMPERYQGNYEVAPLPKGLRIPPFYFQPKREMRAYCNLPRLRRGTVLHRQGKAARFQVATRIRSTSDGCTVYQGSIFDESGLVELWESVDLDTLRRIACGYYPSLCKFFGPARQYAGV